MSKEVDWKKETCKDCYFSDGFYCRRFPSRKCYPVIKAINGYRAGKYVEACAEYEWKNN